MDNILNSCKHTVWRIIYRALIYRNNTAINNRWSEYSEVRTYINPQSPRNDNNCVLYKILLKSKIFTINSENSECNILHRIDVLPNQKRIKVLPGKTNHVIYRYGIYTVGKSVSHKPMTETTSLWARHIIINTRLRSL